MPIRIDNELPAKQSLEIENIFVMGNTRADTQDIRPLKIIILNLMPTKLETINSTLLIGVTLTCSMVPFSFSPTMFSAGRKPTMRVSNSAKTAGIM